MHSLVYHYGGLGDFLTLLPLVAQLRRSAEDTVTLLGKPEYGSLGIATGYLDAVLDAECSRYRSLFMPPANGNHTFTSFSATYDTLLLFCSDTAPIFKNAMSEFHGKIYRQNPVPDRQLPIIDYRLSLLTGSSPSDTPVYPDLSSVIKSHQDFSRPATHPGPTVALHPGSGSSRKNWRFTHFISLANQLRNAGFSLCWFTGPSENIQNIPRGDTHFRNLSLMDTAAIVSRCNVYAGNDCGFSHLAAACGCPAVVLFGPSDPKVWAPRGKQKVTTIHHPTACGPCHLISSRATCASACLESITVEEVEQSLLELYRSDCYNFK